MNIKNPTNEELNTLREEYQRVNKANPMLAKTKDGLVPMTYDIAREQVTSYFENIKALPKVDLEQTSSDFKNTLDDLQSSNSKHNNLIVNSSA